MTCFRYTLVVLLLTLAGGCGNSRPETAIVEGRITWHGKPVTTGTIMFYPATGRPATGSISSDGSYRLTTFVKDDGATLGKHVVTIQASEIVGGDNPQRFEDEYKGLRAGELKSLIPTEYADRTTSGLTAEVQATKNRIDFNLPR